MHVMIIKYEWLNDLKPFLLGQYHWKSINEMYNASPLWDKPWWSHISVYLTVTLSLTHWGRDKMAAVSQTTHSNAFSWMKMLEFRLRFHWSLFLRVQLTLFQHCFRYWLGAVQATSHYLNQWWLVYWRIYASLGLNELMASNVACRRRIYNNSNIT